MSKFCKNCGNELMDDDNFCNICGTKAEVNNNNEKKIDDEHNMKRIKIRILYRKESMMAPSSKKIYIDGIEVEVRNNEIVEYVLDRRQEHIIKWDKDNPDDVASYKFRSNGKDINLLISFKTVEGVDYKIINGKLNVNSSKIKRRNSLKIILTILVIFVIILMINLFNKIRYSDNLGNGNNTTSSYSNELSKTEANRLFEATLNYLSSNRFLISDCGKILNEGTYRCKESKNGKYMYEMNIKYNPTKKNGDIDVTSIRSRTVYTVYDAKTDNFSVHVLLYGAQQEMNK